MFARALVEVIAAPGIFGDTFEVRAVPAGDIARLNQQVIEPVAAFRIVARIDFEGIEGGFEVGDLGLGSGDARLLAAPHDLGINDGCQRRQDNQDQQHFDQGEATTAARSISELNIWFEAPSPASLIGAAVFEYSRVHIRFNKHVFLTLYV